MLRQKQVKLALIVLGVWLMLAALFAALPSLSALLGTVYVQENSRGIGVVRVESNQPGVLEISWDAPAETPLDYRVIWARVGESFPSRPDDPGNAYPTSPSYMSMGLDQGVRYQVQVRARYEASNGDWSAPVEAVVASASTATSELPPVQPTARPGQPQNLRAEVTHNSVSLNWSAPGDNGSVSGYQILRRDRNEDPVDQFSILEEDTGSPATSYVDSTVLPDGQYTYRVRALNGTVLGFAFAHVDANTLSVPSASTATPTAVDAPAANVHSAAAPTAAPAPTAVLPQVPLQGIPSPTPISERDVLAAVYRATGGPHWALNTNWLSDEPIGNWHGVTADESGSVIELNLNRNFLYGSIPAELGSLTNLKTLRMAGNSLVGSIPVELGNLTALTNLDLQDNILSGSIPTELGKLSNLAWLELSENQLSGSIPLELSNLTNLTVLALSHNQLTGTFPLWLKELDDLQILKVSGNQFTGCMSADLLDIWIDDLDKTLIPTCREALITFYFATGGSEWEHNTNWRRSDISLAQWFGVTTDDDGRVTAIDLSGNKLVGALPARIGNLIYLEKLDLSGNELAGSIPPELGNLANLSTLYLGGNRLTGCVPASLREIENNDLDSLGLDFCQ